MSPLQHQETSRDPPLQLADPAEGALRAPRPRQGRCLLLRPHGLQPGAHRQRASLRHLRRPPLLARVPGARRQAGDQHHRRRRQDHQEGQRRRTRPGGGGGGVHRRLRRGHRPARHPAPRRGAQGHRDHRRDHRPGLPAHLRRARLRGGRQRVLQGAQLRRLRQAQRPAHRRARGGRARRRRARQGRPPRLRRLEGRQAGRAGLGQPLGPRPARLAHRVLGHGPALPRRRVRRARRRPRPHLPAPRERDRPERSGGPAVRQGLDAQRHDPQRGREDGQERRQHLPAARGARPLRPRRRAHVLPDDALPQPARVQHRQAG